MIDLIFIFVNFGVALIISLFLIFSFFYILIFILTFIVNLITAFFESL